MLTLTLTTEQQFWRISRCPNGGQNEGIIYLQLCWMERVQHQVHGATATAGTTDGTLPTASLRHPPCRYTESIFAYLTLLQVPHPDQVALVHQVTLAYFRVNYIPKKWSKVRDGILRFGCKCEKAAGKGYEKLYGLMRYVYRVLA